DFIPTFAAAAGEPDLVEKVKKGYTIGDKTYKAHLDGFNLMPVLKGEVEKSPRQGSSTGATTATCSPCGFTTGRSCSKNSATLGLPYGGSRSRKGVGQSSSTCAPIPSSAATKVSSTTNGRPIEPLPWFRRKCCWANGLRPSKSSRLARSRRASASTRL